MNYTPELNFLGVPLRQLPCFPGKGAPTTATEGEVGDFYMDTDTGIVYKCTAVNDGVYTWVEFDGGDSIDGDFPTFEKIEGDVEYNEIAKAVEVSTLAELQAYDGTAILKGYRHTYTTAEPDANYNLLKIPVQPGDVIRDKLVTWWLPQSSGSSAYWMAYYTADNTKIGKTFTVLFPAHESTNCLDIRENGLTIPDNCSYVLVNISNIYWYDIEPGEPYNQGKNGFTASIITKNADANLTAYDGTAIAPDYVSVGDGSGESYYKAIDDVRIPRYEDALGDIEAILADVVGGA